MSSRRRSAAASAAHAEPPIACGYKQSNVSIAERRRTHAIKGLSFEKLNRIAFMWIADSFRGRVFETPQDIDTCGGRRLFCLRKWRFTGAPRRYRRCQLLHCMVQAKADYSMV
jgi:hypothetical protein